MPLAAVAVYQMLLDKLPAVERLLQGYFVVEVLVQIDVADYVLGLHPPMAVGIGTVFIEEGLVNHAAFGRHQAFVGSGCNVFYQRLYFFQKDRIAQYQRGFMNQPGSLDIVSVGNDAVFAYPVVVEEELQMAGVDVQNTVDEELYQVAELLLQAGVLPYTVEVGIRLQDVQDGCSWSCAHSRPWR